ncbi:MAG TPA: glycosyltransferase family protein [Stellaceae bacterium]|nr:glycosyltransferase family protein [Stellaceae bacterium]
MNSAPRTACIVQARVGSTRLPGKVLETLGHAPVLDHVLRRCRAIAGVDAVVCATVEGADGDAVAALAQKLDVTVFRGSEKDVLARYHGAAHAVDADIILRVTSDCPLIDPDVCAAVLRLRAETEADYAANNMPPSWPHGLDCEAFTIEALDEAAATATAAEDHEHVTPWIRRNRAYHRVNLPGPGGELAAQRWTLDYPEDLAFLRAVYDRLPEGTAGQSWHVAADILSREPELALINESRRQR